jgi:2-octaprenyl-6-methoxyphenol hydroxylase
MDETAKYDVIVAGGGIAGLTATALLGALGFRTLCLDRQPGNARDDGRTTALLASSLALLERAGIDAEALPEAAPMNAMRIVDLTVERGPDITFDALALTGRPFGSNIPNAGLHAALAARIAALPTAGLREGAEIAKIEFVPEAARVTLTGGETLEATLLLGADGRDSPSRRAGGIAVDRRDYGQTALVCNLRHEAPHEGVSIEHHLAHGPCTFVPMPGEHSSLVWVETPARAAELAALDDAGFVAALVEAVGAPFGTMAPVTPRQAWPLVSLHAERYAAPRLALIGEAAHALHPIGAQGLNLTFRDIAALASALARARQRGHDYGSGTVLKPWERARRPDIESRVAATRGLNALVVSDLLPARLFHRAGLAAVGRLAPLQKLVTRFWMDPPGDLPELPETGAA